MGFRSESLTCCALVHTVAQLQSSVYRTKAVLSLRLKTPSVNHIDMESSAPTGLFCWFGAAVTPNYQLPLVATCLLEPKVLELDPSMQSQKKEHDAVPAAEGRRLQSPRDPCPCNDQVHQDTLVMLPSQVSRWEHPDRRLIQKGRTKGAESQRMKGCKRWWALSCLLLGCCYDSRQAKMDLSSHWVHSKMDASPCRIQCPLLQLLLPYLSKSFNQMEILPYFLQVQPFQTRRSMPVSIMYS